MNYTNIKIILSFLLIADSWFYLLTKHITMKVSYKSLFVNLYAQF